MPLHIYTPGVKVPNGLQPVNPIPIDSWSGPYVGGTTTDALILANATIPALSRFLSLEVRILAPDPGSPGQTLAYKYWYRGSTLDAGLVEFSSASAAAVTGASLGANTFTELNTFNAGITTAFIYASTGSTFGGRVHVADILNVVGGVTLQSTLDVTSVAKFRSNVTLGDEITDTVTATGTFLGLTSSSLITANAGITTAFLYASTGSTFGGTLKVVGGATFDSTVAVVGGLSASRLYASTGSTFGGILHVNGGATFASTVAVVGGLSASSLYASTGSTFGGILNVNGGATFASTVAVVGGLSAASLYASTGSTFGGTLKVVGGATFDSTLDVGGVARFGAGITTSTLNASAAIRANGGLTASTLDVEGVSKFAGGTTFSSSADFASAARFAVGLTSSGDVVVGSAGTVLKTNGDVTIGKTLTVNGNFFVTGTVTTVNRTDLAIDDKIITLGRTLGDDTLADDGGLILVGDNDIKLTWRLASDAWTSSRNFNVNTGSGYKVDNTTALASGMVHGLSLSAGIITGGTWEANSIGLTYGGTNKNLTAVGASGGVVYKDGTGLTITAAGTNSQILSNSSGTPVWVNTTSLTGLTADRVKITPTNTAATYYLTFVDGSGSSKDLFVDTTTGVTYDAASGVLSCVQLEALVDGGVF